MSGSIILPFGKFKGQALDTVPNDYLGWLLNPVVVGKRGDKPTKVDVPAEIAEAALALINQRRDDEIRLDDVRDHLAGITNSDTETVYVLEDRRDFATGKLSDVHDTLDLALAAIDAEYPIEPVSEEEAEFHDAIAGELVRSSPCPKRDQILIWEVLPTGHRKVVWHFSGTRFSQNEHGIAQGKLPGDEKSLYDIARASGY
ncbi:DUF3820 family protein [Erythrobacter aureus]|nr:DUF3820 family protein [Erythrobacter aureus]